MRIRKSVVGIAAGLAVAAIVASLFPVEEAFARRRRGKSRGTLRLVDVNVGDFSGVPQNHVLEFTFTQQVSANSVDPATFQIRAENANGTGFSIQVPGDFQLFGNKVRFFPRLPTHLRDPNDPEGGFYSPGEVRDNAGLNAGFQPDTNHQVTIIGHPSVSAVRTRRGRKLNKTQTTRFTTAPEAPKTLAFTTDTYVDLPPPAFQFSNPPDKVANVADQYAIHGGTRDVPNDIAVTLFGNRVPLSPDTIRKSGNVQLILLERNDDPSVRKPISGTPYVEQNFDTVRMVYGPFFPLPDVGTYALRVTKDVKDLTDTFTFKANPERLRLREIYDFLDAARINFRNTNGREPLPNELPDPPIDLIFDWPQGPQNAAERAVLKGNVLALGDSYPDEIDPRVMVLFSTRNEPVSEGVISLEFVQSDGYFDEAISTAQWDEAVPGAVAAISTIAGGNAADGDYNPAANETVSADDYPGRTINWRKVNIPPGVIVTITGTRPATIKALELTIEGEFRADGFPGGNASTGSYKNGEPTQIKGGKGGPGGGDGADSADKYSASLGTAGSPAYDLAGSTLGVGGTGDPGHDIDGKQATPNDGGQGGLGGQTATGTYYRFGGGGGGGGARTAGGPGAGTTAPYPTWDGVGGAGGAGSNNSDLDPLVGGAGGGSGGNSTFPRSNNWNWNKAAGAGGGGGGALLIQTATVFTVGSKGLVRARGGRGGNGTGSSGTLNAGPGGGGGGGSLLLRTTRGFNFSNEGANTDVTGGAGGTQSGNYVAPFGGPGGQGYVRLEDPNVSGPPIPGSSVGEYNPVGGGEPSVAYTDFIGFGVEEARIVNPVKADFEMSATSNDAVYIEIQFAIEDPVLFGEPKLDALLPDQSTSEPDEISTWLPIRVVDRTGISGGAFGEIEGQTSNDQVFPIADMVNGKQYKFFRCRYTFQLDDSQGVNDIFPNVGKQAVRFQFNF